MLVYVWTHIRTYVVRYCCCYTVSCQFNLENNSLVASLIFLFTSNALLRQERKQTTFHFLPIHRRLQEDDFPQLREEEGAEETRSILSRRIICPLKWCVIVFSHLKNIIFLLDVLFEAITALASSTPRDGVVSRVPSKERGILDDQSLLPLNSGLQPILNRPNIFRRASRNRVDLLS